MQTTKLNTNSGHVFIAAYNDDEITKHIKGPNGTTIDLKIPKKWNEFEEDYAQQDGIVVAAPETIIKRDEQSKVVKDKNGNAERWPVQIKPGDRVFTTHHLCHNDNAVADPSQINFDDKPVWRLEYDQCYCVADELGNVTKVLGHWVLLTPIPEKWETETGVLKTYRVYDKENYAIVAHMSDRAKEELDMKEGDKVFIHKRATYRFKINGTVYFRARMKDIYAVVNEE